MNKLQVIKTMYTFIFIRVVYFNCLYTVSTGVYIDIHMCKSNASLHSLTLQQEVLKQTHQDLNPGTTTHPRPIPPSFPPPMISKLQKPSFFKYTAKIVQNIETHTVN